ncbi:hypothetical protein BHE74_00013042 [Ensete ventricosum]|nr:hypothetical protein BHE74_00013042 [Ensete ventricosum]
MDYSLAALKLFCGELKDVRPASASSVAATLFGILFQRAWLQVRTKASPLSFFPGRFLLDDGSDVIELLLSAESQPRQWKIGRSKTTKLTSFDPPPMLLQSKSFPLFLAVSGMYVMVVGPYIKKPFCYQTVHFILLLLLQVHKIVDLSQHPDREAMWHLEVMEAHKLFYLSLPR